MKGIVSLGLTAALCSCGGSNASNDGGGGPPPPVKYTHNVIYRFTGGADGGGPSTLVSDPQGNLYGTTSWGGNLQACTSGLKGCGAVFKLSPPASGVGTWIETVLYTFSGGADGGLPFAGLVFDSNGNLYGNTFFGGLYGFGTVFELSPPASAPSPWTETVLYSFTGGADGGAPSWNLVFDASGNLYGTTLDGGSPDSCALGPCGVVFELSPPVGGSGPWTESVLYGFKGGADGGFPGGLTFDTNGNLYGTTNSAGVSGSCVSTPDLGAPQGCGVVFGLVPPNNGPGAWTENLLYSFTGAADGGMPNASLVLDAQGNLYGTASVGGDLQSCPGPGGISNIAGCGVVFEVRRPNSGASTWNETTLYTFTDASDGAEPNALTFDSGGNLYGTSGCNATECGFGVVFKLTRPASGTGSWKQTVLYTFPGNRDEGSPRGLVIDSKGNLYGTARDVGLTGMAANGLIYQLSPD